MMFKMVLWGLRFLQAQIVKVQAQRAKTITRAEAEIFEKQEEIKAAASEQAQAARIEGVLKGVVG